MSLKLTPHVMPYQVSRIRFSEGDPLKSLQCNMSIDVSLTLIYSQVLQSQYKMLSVIPDLSRI